MVHRPFDPHRIAGDVMTRLRAGADEERRLDTAGYSPTSMVLLGVGVPVLRSVATEYARALRDNSPEDLLAIARALIATGTHEGRQAAYEMIAARRDVAYLIDTATIRELGYGNDNWASVDAFALLIAGPAWRDARIPDAEVLQWATSDDVWWRCTALLATVALNARARGGQSDAGRTFRVCRTLVADRHPMIVKALSWALRELLPHDPDAVAGFIAAHDVPALVSRDIDDRLRTGTWAGH